VSSIAWSRRPVQVVRSRHRAVGLILSRRRVRDFIGADPAGAEREQRFTEDIVRELARKTQRPIILPLSNPTSHAEAHPAELDEWTDGRALIATGSPFAPLQRDGVARPIAQCNNVYIFPAMGRAVTAAQATRVTDEMMRVAAATLGEASPALADPHGRIAGEMDRDANDSFFVEGLGSGLLYSVNYERIVEDDIGFRLQRRGCRFGLCLHHLRPAGVVVAFACLVTFSELAVIRAMLERHGLLSVAAR